VPDNTIELVITASDKASDAIKSIGKVLKSITGAISDLEGEYIAYGDQIENMARLTGNQSEEASRMIQVADDLSVSYDDLSTSIKAYSNYLDDNEKKSQKLADATSKYADEQKKSMEELNDSLIDISNTASEKLESALTSHSDNLKNLTQSIKELEQDYNDDSADQKQELNDRLSDMDQDYADNREDLERDLSRATSAEQARNIKERISELEQDYQKRRSRSIRDAQQAQERVKREQDQRLELAKERIQKENQEYRKQTAIIKEQQLEQEQSAKESFDRQAKYAADAYAKQFASIKAEIANMQSDVETPTVPKVNINELAELSRVYLSLPEGVERTNFALERFGRNGTEMMKILETGPEQIRAMAANIESGLIIDQKKAESIKKIKKQLDAFNDSMAAIRYEVAGDMLELFQQLPQPIQDSAIALGSFTEAGMIDRLANISIILKSVGDIAPKLKEAGIAMKALAVASWATAGPVLAVAAAIASAAYAIKMLFEFIGGLINMLQKAAANGKLWEFMKALNMVNIVKNIDLKMSANKLLGRASGGSVTPGRAYMVGERGPEPFIPSVPGTILPNGTGFGSGMNFQFVYAPIFSPGNQSEVENVIRPAVLNILRGRA